MKEPSPTGEPGRALVCGWFSFPWMGATAGDLLAAETAGRWLQEAGLAHDVAVSDALAALVPGGGVRWESVDPAAYRDVIFVCGPVGDAPPLTDLLARFPHCRRSALDVTMLQRREEWDPFDHWWARDGDPGAPARPDLAWAAPATTTPLAALVLVHDQQEYPEREHEQVHALLRDSLARLDIAVVEVDTCFDPANTSGLRTPGQVEAVLRAADVVVTTRLHGLVLGLRNGTPVLAVDAVTGGAKVTAQARALGWPELLAADVGTDTVHRALERLLGGERDDDVARCRTRAEAALAGVRDDVLATLAGAPAPSDRGPGRG